MGEKDFDLLNLESRESFIRQIFDKKLNLKDKEVPLYVPFSFKDKSFFPKKGLNLEEISNSLKRELISLGASPVYVNTTIPGIIEAIKNAYEHGNNKEDSKKIILLKNLGKRDISYIVGDEGGEIDGNFFPYLDLIRKERFKGGLISIPDFYSFCGESHAPLGHSGVGTIVIHRCFEKAFYLKNKEGGLSLFLSKPFSQMMR